MNKNDPNEFKNFIPINIPIILFGTIMGCKPDGQPEKAFFYNVKDFGALGDSSKLDNEAIQKAIDQVSQLGGGTIYIPPGNYLIAPINLKSNITLYIEKGATLHASTNFDDYPYVETR